MKKVAVIGTGMAGMSISYFLRNEYDITVFEKNNYIGGHTNTVEVEEEGKKLPVDTGFMVFNEVTYPLLIKLFNELGVDYYNTDMSFSVKHIPTGLEYNGSSVDGLFCQRKNILNPTYLKMLYQINRFNKQAPKLLESGELDNLTIMDMVNKYGYGPEMFHKFLSPMSSAVWSTPPDKMGNFPAKTLVQFFYNHGFLGLDTQHQWKTVKGGSREYRNKLISSFENKIHTSNGAKKVRKLDNMKYEVKTDDGQTAQFDHVIFACHADEALELIKNPNEMQGKLLAPFKYQENIAVLHQDKSVMPITRKAWSSWNYVLNSDSEAYTVYYMNSLQKISDKNDYFININGEKYVDKSKVLQRIVYHHPLFNNETQKAQETLFDLNRLSEGLFFCGSYFRYGFHEDALLSSVNLANFILKREVL